MAATIYPDRLWKKDGYITTPRGKVAHWVLVHPGPPEEVDYFTALAESLPKGAYTKEALEYILNLAAMARARERLETLNYGTLHHALQPCSVCDRLLAVKVNAQGEIESSGNCIRIALSGPYWHPYILHQPCYEDMI